MRQELTSLAKISRPIPRDVFLRKRLFSKLDRLRQSPVIWVSGPPGSGKTTIISSYIESCSIPCLWYQVDQGDSEAATFFHFLGLAVKKAAPRKRRPLPHLTPELQKDLSMFTRRFFQETFSRLKAPSIVVLDNYQDALDEPLFHEVIRDGLSEVPQGVNVMVLSHNDPPQVFARMRANQLIELITYDDLRLTPEESRGIADMRGTEDLSEETLKYLQEKTEGWVAGLVLMLERMKIEGLSTESMSGAAPEVIFDYFVSEVFGKLDEETRDLLIKAALFPSMTGNMAKELTLNSGAGSILSDLVLKNCFTVRHIHKEKVYYQFHYLFRQFLLNQGEEKLGSQTLKDASLKAAEILLEHSQAEAAAEIYKKAEAWSKIASLIIKEAPQMLKEGRNKLVEGWFQSLPEEMLEADPWLTYYYGLCRLSFNPKESNSYFERAYSFFKTVSNDKGMLLSLVGKLDSVLLEMTDYRRVDNLIEELDRLKGRFPELFSREKIVDRVTSTIFYAILIRRPDHPDFELWKEKAIGILDKKAGADLKIYICGNLIVHYFWAGDFAGAAMALDRMKSISASHGINLLVEDRMMSAEMLCHFTKANSKSCYRLIAIESERALSRDISLWNCQNLNAAAAMALSSGEYEAAGRFLKQTASVLEAMASVNKLQASFYHDCTGWLALSRGDSVLALTHFKQAMKSANELGVVMITWVANYGMAQALHEHGKYKEALIYLNKAHRIGRQIKSAIIEFMCLAADAQFAFDRGEDTKALKSLNKAFALGKEKDFVNFLLWRYEVMTRLCVKALEHGIETEYAKSLISRRSLVPETPPVEIEEWPWPVKIYTLGRFEIEVNGKPVTFSKKAPKKPIEMLKALIALGGGKDVSETMISDALWPEADGDAAHRAFITTLMRLRKLIGVDKALRFNEGRLSLDPRYCWVDFRAFERHLNSVEERLKKDDTEESINSIDKAAGLYQGPFLVSDDGQPWALSIRENLKKKYIRSLGDAGQSLEKAGKFKKAVYYYNKGIETDEFAEGLYHRLMFCYKNLGRRGKAIAVYNRLENTLSSNFGIKPSPEVKNIYKSLLDE